MIDIKTALQNILKAVYGKDVRQSIHDAIDQINQNVNEAVDLAQIKFGIDITSPTSPVGDYIEGTVYFNIGTGIIWRLNGGSWNQLGSMKSINNISQTSSSGLIDTYTITYNDGTTKEYIVTNGEKGVSITNITKKSSEGNVDHYDVNLSDGTTTPNSIDVTNGVDGVSIEDISLASTVGNVDNYDVNLSNGTKTPTGFSVKNGISSYVHVRYSANFDGSGMVSVPTDQTVYIGIVVTTQSTAPTDPAVYSWVRFIGKSGTGTGDMLKSEYSTKYNGVVDKAAALFDGENEVDASELLSKTKYASKGIEGTVDKATELVDTVNNKVADTKVLAAFSDDGEGIKYKGEEISGKSDNDTIVKNEKNELKVSDELTEQISNNTTKLSELDSDVNSIKTKTSNLDENGKIDYSNVKNTPDISSKLDKPTTATSGQVLTYNGTTWEAQNPKGGAGTASDVSYSNSESGLESTNVQDAIDEVNDRFTWKTLCTDRMGSTIPLAGIDFNELYVQSGDSYGLNPKYGVHFIKGIPARLRSGSYTATSNNGFLDCTYNPTANTLSIIFYKNGKEVTANTDVYYR